MTLSEIKHTLLEAGRSQTNARDSLASCPDLPDEVRRCLAHLLEANDLLGSAVKLLAKELDPNAKRLADIISTVAQDLVSGLDRWNNKQTEMLNFVTLLVELGHEGEFGLADLRDIAQEAGVMSESETKMGSLLQELRRVGALADAGPKDKRLYRVGEALTV